MQLSGRRRGDAEPWHPISLVTAQRASSACRKRLATSGKGRGTADDEKSSSVLLGKAIHSRNMMDHPGIGMSFQSAEPIWSGGGSVQMNSITNFGDGPFRADYSAIQIGYNNTAQNSRAGMKALSMGLVGRKLDEEIRRRTAHGVDMYVNHERLAHPDNRLVLSKTHRDALGIPHPEVTYDVGEYVRKSATLSREHLKRIAEALGGTEIEITSFFTPNNHITGGTIMGLDPKDSVVDGWLRTHDHPNLFLATGAAMAAAGTVNSTLTMAALSLRAGDAILRDLKHV